MGNCLVKKLKASVPNSDLPYFDSAIIIANSYYLRIGAIAANTCLIQCIDSDTPDVSGNGETSWGKTAYLPLDPGNESSYWGIIFRNYESGMRFRITNPASLSFLKNVAKQDVADLSICVNLRTLMTQTSTTELTRRCYGDVSALKTLVNLEMLDINNSLVTGRLESLVEGLIDNNISEHTVKFKHSGKTTFNSIVANSNKLYKLIFANGGCSVYEDSSTASSGQDTLIGSYNGSTWTYV